MKTTDFFAQYTELVSRITYSSMDKDTGIMRTETYVVFVNGQTKARMREQEYTMAKQNPAAYQIILSPASQSKPWLKQAELGFAPQPEKKQTKAEKAEKTA
jgi:hypothetical protein